MLVSSHTTIVRFTVTVLVRDKYFSPDINTSRRLMKTNKRNYSIKTENVLAKVYIGNIRRINIL